MVGLQNRKDHHFRIRERTEIDLELLLQQTTVIQTHSCKEGPEMIWGHF